ncbi:MAG: phosphoenolpyruvate carboxylase, partial [Deinococcus sp.]
RSGPDFAARMYRQRSSFHSMFDNAQMSLVKSDSLIVGEYLRLSRGAGEGEAAPLAALLEEAYRETVGLVEAAVGSPLLTAEPRLKRSIELRNPYIDPIHRLQVELLRRARAHAREEAGEGEPPAAEMPAELERPLLLSVQGISAGVRNTG